MSERPLGFVLRRDEPMARHSPWRVGGPVEAYMVVTRRDGLADALSVCREHQWKRNVIGAGTRTVFRDGGSSGVVLRLGSAFAGVTEVEQGWWIGAAAPLSLIGSRFVGGSPKTTLSPLRFLPGSVGASLALDEGWEPWVESVKWIQRSQEHTCPLHEVPGKGSVVFTEVLIRRTPREKARPPAVPHGWFKTEDDDAADLLRDTGLSATRLRGVLLPEAEPDVLVNLGDGTSKDFALLQKSIVEKIQDKRGVALQDAMTWIGRP